MGTPAEIREAHGNAKRAKRAQLEAEEAKALKHELKPRSQPQWLEEERKATKLPQLGKFSPEADRPTKKRKIEKVKGTKVRKEGDDDEEVKGKKVRKEADDDEETTSRGKDRSKGKGKGKGKVDWKKRSADAKEARAAAAPYRADKASEEAQALLKTCHSVADERRILAVAAERITGNPEKEISLFDVFWALHEQGKGPQTPLFAILSATAAFRDLVPGYRIREKDEKEKGPALSKPVIALQKYERAVLDTYRKLLPTLEKSLKINAVACTPALVALLKAASHFNYRQRLIQTVVRYANDSRSQVRAQCAQGLLELFQRDQALEATNEAVVAIGHVVQAAAGRGGSGGCIQADLLESCLGLGFGKAEEADIEARPDEVIDDEEIRAGLEESHIRPAAKGLKERESKILTELFVVYLRILRTRHLHPTGTLSSTLRGLARWAPMVNIELLYEILGELKDTVTDAIDRFDVFIGLQGLHCACTVLSGQAQALHTDCSWLPDQLSAALKLALPDMYSAHSEETTWPPRQCFHFNGRFEADQSAVKASLERSSIPSLMLRSLTAAMRCSQAFGSASEASVAPLAEHLFHLAAMGDTHASSALLLQAYALLRRHTKLRPMLDAEGGLFGLGGITERAISVHWHLHPLSFHVAPKLAKAGQGLRKRVTTRDAQSATGLPGLPAFRDVGNWLCGEVTNHITALADSPLPPKKVKQRGFPAEFATAEGIQRICDNDPQTVL